MAQEVELLSSKHKAPSSIFAKIKRTGGMGQMIEHLLSKCEALSSNSMLQKEKNAPFPYP
jgi:hypothetical protein